VCWAPLNLISLQKRLPYESMGTCSPSVSEPLTYRGVLMSTLLQAILNTFPPFAECIITDFK
jgi:hypothetical protein